MARLVKRSEFARMAGVGSKSISVACQRGLLQRAFDGAHIDADHEDARAYLKRHGVDLDETDLAVQAAGHTSAATQVRRGSDDGGGSAGQSVVSPPEGGGGSSADLEQLADALRPLVSRFGTSTGFAAWLDSLKRIEDIREKRLKNEEAERTLIHFDPVKRLAMGYVDASQRRVLRDASRTIARRVYAMARSGEPVEEAERTVREIIGATLRPVKRQVMRVLKNA